MDLWNTTKKTKQHKTTQIIAEKYKSFVSTFCWRGLRHFFAPSGQSSAFFSIKNIKSNFAKKKNNTQNTCFPEFNYILMQILGNFGNMMIQFKFLGKMTKLLSKWGPTCGIFLNQKIYSRKSKITAKNWKKKMQKNLQIFRNWKTQKKRTTGEPPPK